MYRLLILYFLFQILIGCKGNEEDQKPAQGVQGNKPELPQARFELSDKIVPVGYSIHLYNSSTKAVRYEWNFGNGDIHNSTEFNTSHHYNVSGTYTITLKAYNLNNDVSTFTKTIEVGEVYLAAVQVDKIKFLNPANQPWDNDGTGPDIEFRVAPMHLGTQNPNWFFSNHLRDNFTQTMLPFYHKLSTPLKIYGENLGYTQVSHLYYFGLFEMNGAVTNMDMFITNGAPEYFDTQKGTSIRNLTAPDYDITLFFEVY
ncbi:PKD domain-containing protein [Adhaeribacter soli]|uniref:PKD domain-containing protein n=1 Tax=Adhaeribacter soli TaxID=2607655 RepID=A0A5N1J604_9BACT|nr:PKD domain-containing protein [Adhaeribacter soli]KAA9346120.1 PKD domain-containing protein [Adhaeribacter soli]